MTEQSAIRSSSVLERLVLNEFAALDDRSRTPSDSRCSSDEPGLSQFGRTPVQAPALLRQCRDRLATLDDVVGSRCSEADVVRCCRSLADRGLLTQVELGEEPAVGMGRPAYELAVDPAVIRGVGGDDERFGSRELDAPTP
jgi:hypothetical protein